MGISQAMLDDRSMQEEEEDGGPLDGSKTVEHVHQHYHRMPLLKRIESHLMARFKQSNAVRSGHTTIADGGHGDTGKSHRHSRGHNARPHHGHPQYRKHIIQERQQQRQHERATVILSNNKYSTSATATVTLAADDVPSPYNATPPLSSSSSGQLHERQSSPPSSLLPTQYTTITLSNYSPILDPPSLATPATDPTTTTTTPTSRRHKPTTSTASARTSTPRRKPASTKTQPTQARRPLTRTTPSRTSNKTPPLSSQSPTCVILPAEPPPLPRISNVVHICIARSPVSDANATPPPPITFTSTVLFSNGLDPLTRPTPTTRRDDNWNTWSRDANFNNNNNGSPPPATIITVTDYNCQLTLPRFSRPASTRSFTSGPTLSPSNGLNVDNSTLSPIGPNAADPTTGNGDIDISDGKVDDETAFFATPGGKGTIAGISIASAILLLSFVLFFVWRKKKNGNGTTVAGHGDNRGSASTFGDSSGDPGGANGGSSVGNGDQAVPSATLDPHIVSNMHPEMSQLSGTGPPGSFFVQRRSQPSSLRGTDTPPRATYTNQLDAATAARAISPLAMLQARPQAFIPPPPPPHRTASRAGYSNEGANSDEDKPSSGSSHGHDPFKDPSSTGHTSIRHEIGTVAPFSDKHQRRRSGYTSDTYRKRRSRPLSVRNPDSDETRQQDGVESLYVNHTPRSNSSDALYTVDNAPIPDSAGLEYYLGSTVPTPRGNTPIPAASLPPLPPMPQNTLVEDEAPAATPRAPHNQSWAAWDDASVLPQQLHQARNSQSAYDGMMQDYCAAPSQNTPEFEPQETYAYPQPRAIVSTASSGILSRSHLHPPSVQSGVSYNVHPAAGSAIALNPSQVLERGNDINQRTQRQSLSSSDGASSRSSLWRAWEHNNRSWVNEGFETPSDVQDVQLGSNAGAVGGGNATSISGYFAWR